MAKLEIDLAPEEQTQLEQKAQRAGLPVREWVRHRLLDNPPIPIPTPPVTPIVTFTTDDGEVIEIPDLPEDVARATAIASEEALGRFWNSREDNAAWNGM